MSDQLELAAFSLRKGDDEIRVDRLCSQLLRHFHNYLLEELQLAPLEAGIRASGADYFLRDYVIDCRRGNIFRIPSEAVKFFAGNWYITHKLEPNLKELQAILAGISSFYHYCAARQLVTPDLVEEIDAACNDLPTYQQRIDTFFAIEGDGYAAWFQGCPER
jgi:hypothetical protein